MLAAFRGREAEAAELIDATIRNATAGGQGIAIQYAHWANAVVMNGLGRYDDALAAATVASGDTPELFMSAWAHVELIEAASADREDRARGACADPSCSSRRRRATPTGRSASRRGRARC